MDSTEFREFGKAVIDLLAEYIDTIREKDTIPDVEPGYLVKSMPESAPEEPGDWRELLQEFNSLILPGVTHWHSPRFHAYYPTGQSWPSIVGSLLCDGLGVIGFSWIASPACTELEVVTLNWLGKLLNLPEEFLSSSSGQGGGVIQGSASEATLVCLLAAADKTIRKIQEKNPQLSKGEIRAKLISYTSDQSNSSVEKAGVLASIPMRLLKTGSDCKLRAATLREAIENDKSAGLIPFYVVSNLGTTGTCAFDPLDELGPLCRDEDIWLHVDAAYAGSAFICPEYRHYMNGIEYVQSFNFNAHKWLLVNFDCSALWVRNSLDLINAFNIQRIYLPEIDGSQNIPDYRHWQMPLGRRFRALKLWTVMKIYGAEGLRNHIRTQTSLAQYFAQMAKADPRFIVAPEPVMGLVCFRLKGGNSLTKKLYENILSKKKIYLVAATYQEHYIIRFVVCARTTTKNDIEFSWGVIKKEVDDLCPLDEISAKIGFPALKNLEKTADITEKSV